MICSYSLCAPPRIQALHSRISRIDGPNLGFTSFRRSLRPAVLGRCVPRGSLRRQTGARSRRHRGEAAIGTGAGDSWANRDSGRLYSTAHFAPLRFRTSRDHAGWVRLRRPTRCRRRLGRSNLPSWGGWFGRLDDRSWVKGIDQRILKAETCKVRALRAGGGLRGVAANPPYIYMMVSWRLGGSKRFSWRPWRLGGSNLFDAAKQKGRHAAALLVDPYFDQLTRGSSSPEA